MRYPRSVSKSVKKTCRMLPKNIFEQHTHVGLDLDETLASTVLWMLEHAHASGELLMCHNLEDVCHYDLTKIDPELTLEEASHIWEWYGKLTLDPLTVPPLPYSKEAISALIGSGVTLSIITARSDREAWKVDRTKAWVQTHFPEIGESRISFVNHFYEEARPKSVACREHGVTLMIDDSIENAQDLALAGIGCILLDKPWNRDIDFTHPLVYRIKDWTEVLDNLKSHV